MPKNIRIDLGGVRRKPLLPPKKILQVKKVFNLKSIVGFSLSVLILVLILQGLVYLSSARNAKGEILGEATTAYSDIHDASASLSSSNFSKALELFASAQENLRSAKETLDNFKALQWLTPQAQSADHLLSGAEKLALAGQKLSVALKLFDELQVSHHGIETTDFNQKLSSNNSLLKESLDLIEQAESDFNEVSSLPANYSQSLNEAKQQVSQLSLILKKLVGLEDLYLNFFGKNKTYLLVFQNYDEARATGGFIGTYGILKLKNGSIDQLKIESIYNLDGSITAQIAAPGPFQPLIRKWGMRDANWFVDFPASAEKLLYFFELGSQTADGVIAFTPSIFEDLLQIVGPIDMPEYKITLTAENFQELVQFKTSDDYDLTLNQPKKFLADFAPLLLDRLMSLNREQWFSLLQVLETNLQQKQALLYSKDPVVESQIDKLGYSGKILSTDFDYLNIVNTNLGGTKTDLSVQQNVNLKSKILSDGSLIDTLSVQRSNDDWDSNKDYLRVLVPKGSQLISASGFDPYNFYRSEAPGLRTDQDLMIWDEGAMEGDVFVREEAGKTEFAGWLTVEGKQSRSITLTYALPFKISSDQGYSLLLQKQNGSRPYSFEGNLSLGIFNYQWLSSGIKSNGRSVTMQSYSNQDDFWGMVLSK